MKRTRLLLLFLITCSLSSLAQTMYSPRKNIKLQFELKDGVAYYSILLNGKTSVAQSQMGLTFKRGESPSDAYDVSVKNEVSFHRNLIIVAIDSSKHSSTWQPVLGEQKNILNCYNELAVTLQQQENRPMVIRFRVFDDGVGFRYEFPEKGNDRYYIVKEEHTQFAMPSDNKTFWIPSDYDSQEYTYSTTKISEIDASIGTKASEIGSKSHPSQNAVQTPLMMKSPSGMYLNIHEAALVDFPVMHLEVNKESKTFKSLLVPDALGNKAYIQTPFYTPWRTIVLSTDARDILASKLILNLNEQTSYKDVSWIKPMKYVGVWWEMHVNKSSWNYTNLTIHKLKDINWQQVKPNGTHGANTKRVKEYIDFASKNGLQGVLVEGWNIGWEDWGGFYRDDVFSFTTPYPDFDIAELQRYAKEKGVEMIMHHETASAVNNYERQLDSALNYMKKYGYNAVKTGYVGYIIPHGEHHDGQMMVNHFQHVVDQAAQKRIMVNSHESIRPTGLSRTYPNWISAEAARGNEFNAWSIGNPPEHETILPFTRLIGGPMDYTPGIFEVKMDYYGGNPEHQVHTTLAKQLALYVTMYSPLQMAADLPENYEKYSDAFQFIRDVATDWDETKILEAEPGDYITIARKAKNSEQWFIGAIADENSRIATINLNFLEKGKSYKATIYKDGEDADWKTNPKSYSIEQVKVNNSKTLKIKLANGGGAAITIVKE